MGTADEAVEVWVDQDLCTGDGLCVQLAPEIFEFDIDGLAYVKTTDGELLTAVGRPRPGLARPACSTCITSAKDCPGECIHVARVADGVIVGGPLPGHEPAARAAGPGPAAPASRRASCARAGSPRTPRRWPWPAAVVRTGGGTPGAIRRAVSRKPVWPIMRCSGRTASPSTCQPRTIDSQADGSVKLPCSRIASTVLDSWVVVAT